MVVFYERYYAFSSIKAKLVWFSPFESTMHVLMTKYFPGDTDISRNHQRTLAGVYVSVCGQSL